MKLVKKYIINSELNDRERDRSFRDWGHALDHIIQYLLAVIS